MDPEHASRPSATLEMVCNDLDSYAASVVPWFNENMSDYYFRTHTTEEQVRHMNAIISGQVTDEHQTVTLMSPCRKRITHITPGGSTKELLRIIGRHLKTNIQNARFYLSKDEKLRLDTIILAPQERVEKDCEYFRAAVGSMLASGHIGRDEVQAFEDFLITATDDYVQKFEPDRAARHFRIAMDIRDREEADVRLDNLDGRKESRIMVSVNECPAGGFLYQLAKIIGRAGLFIHRGYADTFGPDGAGTGIISFYVSHEGNRLEPDSELWKRVEPELRLAKWKPPHDLDIFADEEGWSLRRVMLLEAACEFAHQFLIKTNLWAFTSANIVRSVINHRKEVEILIRYFECRFDPSLTPEEREKDRDRLYHEAAEMIKGVDDDVARETLECIQKLFLYTLRCNYYLPEVFGLAFRVDSAFLGEAEHGEHPYGFFFLHGPASHGFHVRYRDMARGGMRLVLTRTQEQFELESNRVFVEATGLALAQQYKNKDIPEGGAKAVLLLGPLADPRLSVKSAINSLLDVILVDGDNPTLPQVVDYIGAPEIIYLGPDENITSEHITWIVDRARKRGYPWPSAFMSSKPGAGINHKQYGVTSLGVIVYTHEVLRALDIDPCSQPFTVKMTGGPKGDVAGNACLFLMRDYGENARILSMSDGHGAAYDPDGLDHAEIRRLIEEDRSIHEFDPSRITGKGGFVASADTPEGVRLRNSLHNTVKADVFIPAGGRPDTINLKNWADYLDEDGHPTSQAIVEGANIFISQPARDKLEERGVLIIHGSSANKTGVICSSYEILGGLVMDEEEFLDIKERYVAEVLDILRDRAGAEARLMLREYHRCGGCKPLTTISMELSKEINKIADMFYTALLQDNPSVAQDHVLSELLLRYCPPVLVEKYSYRILERVPERHIYSLIAAYVSSHIVYSEGVGWLSQLVEIKDLWQVVRTYLEEEQRLNAMLASVQDCDIRDKDELVRILKGAGAKFMTTDSLGLE